jgi:hypothetical protein
VTHFAAASARSARLRLALCRLCRLLAPAMYQDLTLEDEESATLEQVAGRFRSLLVEHAAKLQKKVFCVQRGRASLIVELQFLIFIDGLDEFEDNKSPLSLWLPTSLPQNVPSR